MPKPRGSDRDSRAGHSSRFRPDFDTFIKKKRQQLNAHNQRNNRRFPRNGRFPRNRGFSSRRKPQGGPFNKGTRFPFKARSRSPSINKFYTRRSRSRSSSQSKYNSRKSRSPSSDKCNFSTSRIDSRAGSSFEESFNKLDNLQVERSCSPRESLRITIDNDRCESANSLILQSDYTMSQSWNDRRSRRNEDSSRRSGSGSNYSNSPDSRNRQKQKDEPIASIFTKKHLSGRDMQNYDDDVHAGAIAVKAPPKPVSIASSSIGRNESIRQNVDDLNSRCRKRPIEKSESFTGTSSSTYPFQSSNRELEAIVALTEGSNYNTSAFAAPREEKTLFHCQEVKPSRVKGTLNIGVIPSKKIKVETAPAVIPGLDLEPDEVDEYLYGSEGSDDSRSKSSTPTTSTTVVVETTPSRVSALDPRLRKNSASFAPVSDLHQTVPMPPIQETAAAVYPPFNSQEPSAHYYQNAAQTSSSMELQLPLPTFGVMNWPRKTNSFNANNLKQIPITTSEMMASHNDQNTNNGGGDTVNSPAQSTDPSSDGETKIRTSKDKENALFIIQTLGNKLSKCKNKLTELKDEHSKLFTQSKKRKDGYMDPRLRENSDSQKEMSKKIHEFESKIESLKKKIKEYELEKSSQPGFNFKSIQIKKSLPNKVELSRSNSTSRNESPVEKSKSSQVAYQYVDFRNHFCTHCQEVIPSVDEFLTHLHSKHIDVVNNMQESDRPWSSKSRDNKIQNADKVYPAPIKGVEFMLPCTGFYCKLCKELFGDNASAKLHLESYTHNKNQAKFCKENTHYETKITLQRNAKINRERGSSNVNVGEIRDQSKNDNDVKQAASTSKSLSTKSINKEVLVANNIPENNLNENEGSHTITKPGAKIPIKLKDKGVSNNVILAEAATKAEELKAIKQAESEALKSSAAKFSFKPVQIKKPLSRGPPPPLEEFITIGKSSSPTLPEELASPPPLKLQPNIKPNLPVKIKPEPQDTGYDKYVNSNVGAQDKDEVANGAAIKGPQLPMLSSQNIDDDSLNLNTENIKSEPNEGNDLNIKIVSVQSLNSENGAQKWEATESANLQETEECDPKQTNEEDEWDRATLPDEDQMDFLDEDLCYHENEQAFTLTSNEVRLKIENFATDDIDKL